MLFSRYYAGRIYKFIDSVIEIRIFIQQNFTKKRSEKPFINTNTIIIILIRIKSCNHVRS
ncbi:MAG: hypothetical protein BAJALOKI2v1_210011 [Promethearchaeota archaeon]|nr:MAG: hypothetical protein BAJALOKI2v1_210011 [Candidatus Lokiarchaeota archaeon]